MFSNRLQADLTPNRLARALEAIRTEGRQVIDLTESNPTRAGFVYPDDLLAPLADPRALTYSPRPFGLEDARAAVAADYARRGIEIAVDRIVLTASTSESYSLLFKVLCDPGDEVMVPRPSYPLFEHLTRLDGVVARPYDLEYHGAWSVDIASVERALSPRTRALLIVTPNNPTGSFVKPHELEHLAGLCAERGSAIIADEVFADYELRSGASMGSGLVLARRDALMFSLGGLSKTVGLPQVKLGWIAVSGPDTIVDAALTRLELACDSYLSVSTPVQAAASALLARGGAIRRQIQTRIIDNYAQLTARASDNPACHILPAEGGWYAVLQVPSLESEEDLIVRLLTEAEVLTHPGYFFDFPRETYLIVSLLVPEVQFREGIGRVFRHFDCSAGRTVPAAKTARPPGQSGVRLGSDPNLTPI